MKPIFPLFSSISWSNYWSQLRHYGIAILIFIVGLLLTFATFRFYRHDDLNHEHIEFNRIADLRLFLMRDILLDTIQAMESIKFFFYASEEVTKNDFNIFIHNTLNLHPNYLALGWIDAEAENSSGESSIGLRFINLKKDEQNDLYFFPFREI
jgi:hypothetical protein